MLFANLSNEAIQAGLRQQRDRGNSAEKKFIDDVMGTYKGGPSAASLLTKRPGERPTKWSYRLSQFALPNYLAFIVDYLARGIYGSDVAREWEDGTDEENAALQDLLDINGIWDVQAEMAQSMICAGMGWCNVKYDEPEDRVALIPVYPSLIDWEPDPDNPQRIRTLIERRPYLDHTNTERSIYWVWVDDQRTGESWGRVYDDDGVRQTGLEGDGFDPNPYDLIPYAMFKGLPMVGMQDGLSVVRDIYPMQKLLTNKLSDLVALIAYQAHGFPVRTLGEGEDPSAKVLAGVDEMMTLAPGGSFGFAQPGAAIPEVLSAIDNLIEMMFHNAQLPREAMSGGVAESGVALRLRWQPFIAQTQAARMRAKQFEFRLGNIIAAVASAHGIKGIPQGKKLVPKFDDSVLPTDDVAERANDLADLNNEPPLLLTEDYLVKYRDGIDTVADAKKYMAELEAVQTEREEKKRKEMEERVAANPLFGAGSPFAGNGARF